MNYDAIGGPCIGAAFLFNPGRPNKIIKEYNSLKGKLKMHDSNIKVVLDLKTEFPCYDDDMENIINAELTKELDLYTKQILTKLTKLVKKHDRLKIFKPNQTYHESA